MLFLNLYNFKLWYQMRIKYFILAFILIYSLILDVNAEVRLPSIISDNMVLQQSSFVNIWGTADANETITVTSSWNNKKYTTKTSKDGKWAVKLKTPKASKNQSIIVKGENTVEIKNILIGEVWLCSGQSNMDYPVAKAHGWRAGVTDEVKEMQDADYPEIRLFHVPQKLSTDKELEDCDGHWVVCNVENLKTFSAIAFLFGRNLYKDLKVPVGLIQSTWGGTPSEAWTKMSAISGNRAYDRQLRDYFATIEALPEAMNSYENDLTEYKKLKAEAEKIGTELPKAPKKPQGIRHNKSLSVLWNAMISPIVPYTIKGAVWYQGETTLDGPVNYKPVFSNMINSWRKEWGQGDFPFYFVQIAPHYKQSPLIRESQLKVWQSVNNTGMAVITDGGDSTDIHPRRKQIPALRLANWALAKTYGKNNSYSGPVFKSMKPKGDKLLLTFEYADQGLKTSDGKLLQGFVIAGADKVFYPATAIIIDNKVELSSTKVEHPVAVRYAWDKFFRVNFCNGEGIPATPFRTDNWEITN